MAQTYSTIEIKEKEGSKADLFVTISWEEVKKHRGNVLKELQKEKSIKGFRKGSVPENLLVKEVGEDTIQYRQALRAVENAYFEVVKDEKLDLIGRPHITITKLAPGNPLEFKAEVVRVPSVELPDYKTIAGSVEKKTIEVQKKDVDDVIKNLRREWAKSEKYENALKNAEKKENVKPQDIEISDEELPEFSDEFVKKLGDFKTVGEFEEKLKENMSEEKKLREEERRRIEILEKIRSGSKIALPDLLVEEELRKMLESFKADVSRAGLKIEDYLKQSGKTEEDLRREWRIDASKRVEIELILDAIARKEKIKPEDEKVKEELQKILSSYPDADPLRAAIYVRTVLTNQKVIEFLESEASKA